MSVTKDSSPNPTSYALGKLFTSDLWTNNVCRQILEQIFAPNRGLCLCMSQRKKQSELLTSNWNKLYLVHSYWLMDIDITFIWLFSIGSYLVPEKLSVEWTHFICSLGWVLPQFHVYKIVRKVWHCFVFSSMIKISISPTSFH